MLRSSGTPKASSSSPKVERVGVLVWLDDGTRHTVEDFAAWRKLPRDGVLEVVEVMKPSRPNSAYRKFTHAGCDFYFMTPEGVIGSNNEDPAVTESRYPGAVVLRGKWTTPEMMERVRDEVNAIEVWP